MARPGITKRAIDLVSHLTAKTFAGYWHFTLLSKRAHARTDAILGVETTTADPNLAVFQLLYNAQAQRRPWNGNEGAMERASRSDRPRIAATCYRSVILVLIRALFPEKPNFSYNP